MRLGLVVTDERNAHAAANLLAQAAQRGWECRCFLTDTGVALLLDQDFMRWIDAGKATAAVCEWSVERYARPGMEPTAIAHRVVVGGQYQYAELVRWCERVVVF